MCSHIPYSLHLLFILWNSNCQNVPGPKAFRSTTGSLPVEPNGSECKRKRIRIVKLVKGRCSFASDVRLRNSKNYPQNVFRSILKNSFPFLPEIWLIKKEILSQHRMKGISRNFPRSKLSSKAIWNFLTLSNIDFSYNITKSWKSLSMSE